MTPAERLAEQRALAELRTRDDRIRHDGDAKVWELYGRLS